MKKNRVDSESVVGIKDSVVVILRTYFSIQHIQSAILFAKEAGKIESGEKEKFDIGTKIDHLSYVVASIFAAVAFLEANVNEIFCDSYETMKGKSANDGKNIPEPLITKFGRMWDQGIPRTAFFPILQKYQIALVVAEKSKFDEGSNPFQDTASLVMLRNELIHSEPESVVLPLGGNHALITKQKFFQRLRSKYALNALATEGDPFYPNKCLSYGCCKWGIKSSLAFADEFCNRTGIICKYQKHEFKISN